MRFGQLPLAARAYVLGVCVVAGAYIAFAWRAAGTSDLARLDDAAWRLFALLVVLATLAHSFPVSTPGKQAYHVSLPFFLAGALLLTPLQLAALLTIVQVVEWMRSRRRAVFAQVFNVAAYVLAGGAAQAAHQAIWMGPVELHNPMCLAAGAAAALAFGLVNRVLVSLAIWLGNGIPPGDQQMFEPERLLTDAVLLGMGLPLAYLALATPWAVALGAAPLLLIHRALDLPNVRAQSRRDGLTELFTAQYLSEACGRELSRAQRFDRSVALVLVDVDGLTSVNEEYGPADGDAIIRSVGRLIGRAKREYDLAARLMGGTFAVLAPEVDLAGAQIFAERLRRSIAQRRHEVASSVNQISVTASLGVAVSPDAGMTSDQLFSAAEDALAQAKRGGGNRIVCAPARQRPVVFSREASYELPELESRPAEDRMVAADSLTPPTAPKAEPAQGCRLAWLLAGVTAIFAAGIVGWAAPHIVLLDPITLGLLAGCVVLAEIRGVDLFDRRSYSISVMPIMAAGMLLGVPGAVAVAPMHAIVRGLRRRGRWYTIVANTGASIIAAAAAAAVYGLAGLPLQRFVPAQLPLLLIPAAVAGLIYYLHTFVVAVGMAAEARIGPRQLWAERFRWLWPHYPVLSLMGLLLAVAYQQFGVIGAAAFVAPAVMMRWVAKRHVERTLDNVRQLRTLNEQLEHQAFHDPLTNLANRPLFLNRLEHALTRRQAGYVGVLFIDLDNFKLVNDRLGHQAGDALLIAVARRLHACVRLDDTLARLGGDEFTVLLEHVRDAAEAIRFAERILEELGAPLAIGDQEAVQVAASIGIALASDARRRPDDLLREADLAMYRAKMHGKARYELFDPSMGTHAIECIELETDLRRAQERGELVLHYQPIVNLETGRLQAIEALVRWMHPRRGVVLPASFIPLAEDTGLIVPIGRWVLEEACRQARAWQLQYPSDPPLEVAVNVSARQLQEPGFAAWLTGVLRATGLPPESLKLEITESIGLQDASAMRQGPQAIPQDRLGTLQALREMKALGVKLALDDFGSGASSLASLHRLPIDTLKIDRSLVSKLDTNPETNALVRSIIAVARTLQLGVTAEGIETDEQWARLSAEGCDQGQGSLVGRPQPSEAIDALLAREDAERLKRVA